MHSMFKLSLAALAAASSVNGWSSGSRKAADAPVAKRDVVGRPVWETVPSAVQGAIRPGITAPPVVEHGMLVARQQLPGIPGFSLFSSLVQNGIGAVETAAADGLNAWTAHRPQNTPAPVPSPPASNPVRPSGNTAEAPKKSTKTQRRVRRSLGKKLSKKGTEFGKGHHFRRYTAPVARRSVRSPEINNEIPVSARSARVSRRSSQPKSSRILGKKGEKEQPPVQPQVPQYGGFNKYRAADGPNMVGEVQG